MNILVILILAALSNLFYSNILISQEIISNDKIYNAADDIKYQINRKLSQFFVDSVTKSFDPKRPVWIQQPIDEKIYEGPAFIEIGLSIVKDSSINQELFQYFKDEFNGWWYKTETTQVIENTNIKINYIKFYSEVHIEAKFKHIYNKSAKKERRKSLYSAIVGINCKEENGNLIIRPDLTFKTWRLSNNDPLRVEIYRTTHDDLEKYSIPLSEIIDAPTPSAIVDDSSIACAFYEIIDDYLGKDAFSKKEISSKTLKYVTDCLNEKLQTNKSFNKFFSNNIYNLISQYFLNYFSQPNIKKWSYLGPNEYNVCKKYVSDKEESFKYNYFIKSGYYKNGTYEISKDYKKKYQYEYNHLTPDLKKIFSYDKIDAARFLDRHFISLSTKNNKILFITLLSDSTLNGLFPDLRRNIVQKGIIYDIIEFFSKYSTALMVQDKNTLEESWYDEGVRIININGKKQPNSKGEDIINHICNLWGRRYVWVSYYLTNIRKSFENIGIKFFHWNSDSSVLSEIEYSDSLNNKINLIAVFPMSQRWFNFDKYRDQVTYATVDTVEFLLNIFNIKKAIDYLKNESNIIKPEDYFGMMLYLKHLFRDDNNFLIEKQSYKNKNVINKFLSYHLPAFKAIPDFIKNTFSIDYLNRKEKNELLEFFASAEYERLHLGYHISHQSYILILASYTKLIRDKIEIIEQFN
ncbi:MAG: hypothetical protein QXD48_03730 [Candidatus Aenigmatarchaeota archaeon]